APNSYSVEDTKQLYDLAYSLGCKGITIYRDGSRSEQVLSLPTESEQAVDPSVTTVPLTADGGVVANVEGRLQTSGKYFKKKRPDVLYGATYRKDTPLGKAFITINDDPADHVATEMFVNIGKAGSDVYAANEALGRAITLYLRDSNNPNKEAELVKHFSGIGGSNSVGFGSRRILSVPDAIAKSLIEHSETFPMRQTAFDEWASGQELAAEDLEIRSQNPNHQALRAYSIAKDWCPECHQHTLIHTGGCYECEACGYSKC
ncbi:MAG: ribonucleoside-diphosphate reductase, adenosylcobalamin-dependent, partial [Sulfobacillus thermotolerans]|nr:ribonucleoside-diphosphate reductase, adenosylcobalamin-dependent [Sulfobacillus thermotolerans]